MPLNGIESLFICGGNSVLEYPNELDVECQDERTKETSKKPKLKVHSSKVNKQRDVKNSVRPKKYGKGTNNSKTLSLDTDDGIEEWTRIRNMEKRREIQSLKQQNNDLKKELDVVQELLVKKKGQVDALKKSVNNENSNQNGGKEMQQDIERLKTLESTYTELQQKHQLLLKEKEQILSSLHKVKMEKELAEKQLDALKKEKEEQTIVLQQTSEELEKGKKEIENLYKMYESMSNDKESERLSIECENKLLLHDLKIRCKSAESINVIRTSSIGDSNSPDDDNDDFTDILREEMIELISNLEFEKSQKEEELEMSKNELQKQKSLYEQLESNESTTQSALDDKINKLENLEKHNLTLLQELSVKNKKLEENQNVILKLTVTLKQKDTEIQALLEDKHSNQGKRKESNQDEDRDIKLQQKSEEIQTLLNRKNTEILSAQVDEQNDWDKIERELQMKSPNSDRDNSTVMNNLTETSSKQLIEKDELNRNHVERITSDYQTKVKLFEEQSFYTRQQKEHFQGNILYLKQQLDTLKTEKEENETISGQQQTTTVSSVNNEVAAFLPSNIEEKLYNTEKELAKAKLEKQSLEEDLEKERSEFTNREKRFKAEINEQQKLAENQEDIISKAEYDNQKLERRIRELHETIVDQEEKLQQYMKENVALIYSLEHEKQQHDELKANHESLTSNQDTDLEQLLQCREEELDEYKNRLEFQEIKYETLLKDKEDEISTLEKKITNVQTELSLKLKELKLASAEHEEYKRKTTENIRLLGDEQEAYLINEIERQQSEFKSQIAAAERDREKHIYELTKQHEEKIVDLEVEYDQLKSNEIEILRDDHNTRLSMITIQRDELLGTIKKLELLLLKQKYENDEKLEFFQELVQSKNDELIELQIRESSQQDLLDTVSQTITAEKSKQAFSNEELVTLLEKLESELKEQPQDNTNHLVTSSPMENRHTKEEFNSTWPRINNQHPALRQLSSLNYLRNEPSKLQDEIQRTKEEISTRMNELTEQITMATLAEQNAELSSLTDSIDGRSVYSDELLQSSINSLPEKDFQNISDYLSSPASPYSPSSKNVTGCSTTSLYKNQLQMVTDTFSKLENQCLELNKNTNCSQEQWYQDLEGWKEDVNNRLKVLRQLISNTKEMQHDDMTLPAFLKSIVFRPTTAEVKEIIECVNKKYDEL